MPSNYTVYNVTGDAHPFSGRTHPFSLQVFFGGRPGVPLRGIDFAGFDGGDTIALTLPSWFTLGASTLRSGLTTNAVDGDERTLQGAKRDQALFYVRLFYE